MCMKSEESIDHFLFHCEVTRNLWVSVFRLIGIEWIMPQWVVELLACWKILGLCKNSGRVKRYIVQNPLWVNGNCQ
jgi:hypothetical protein